jgi:excisionase family DNA binding protein
MASSVDSTTPFHELPQLLTVSETATLLRLSPNGVHNLIKAGRLRAFRLSKRLRIARQDLLALAAEPAQQPCAKVQP